MPKILIYLASEKAVVDAYTNSASVSSIVEEMHIAIPENTTVPEGASIPTLWCMLILFEWQPGDVNKTFESFTRLVSDSGAELMHTNVAVSKAESGIPRHRLVENIVGFPIWMPGRLEARLMMREQGKGDYREIASYPIRVSHEMIQTP